MSRESDFILHSINTYYYISPGLTILHFTLFNGTTFIVHALILFPILIVITGFLFSLTRGKISIPRFGPTSFFLFIFLSITLTHFILSINDFSESAVSFARILTSLAFLAFGLRHQEEFVSTTAINSIIKAGITGALIGICLFFGARFYGYVMTHSITADGAIAPLLYLAVHNPRTLMFIFISVIFVLLTGKSANLVAYFGALLIYNSSFKRIKYLLLLSVLIFISILTFNYWGNILPQKLLGRIDLAIVIVENPVEFMSTTGSILTSGRTDEIFFVIDKWLKYPNKFFFGDGLSTIVEYGIDGSRSTFHMSYMKIIDMVGFIGFSFFLLLIFKPVFNSLKYKSNSLYSFYAFCIFVQLILSIFQYTLLQDPLLWIAFGVFLRKRSRFIANGVPKPICI